METSFPDLVQLDAFASDPDADVLSFQRASQRTSLTSWERFKIHQRAEALGLGHRTDDLPDSAGKAVHVWKVGTAGGSLMGASQGFQGVLSRGPEWKNNLRRTFVRYASTGEGGVGGSSNSSTGSSGSSRMTEADVALFVHDLYEQSIHETSVAEDWAPYLVHRAHQQFRGRRGRNMVSTVTRDIMTRGGGENESENESGAAGGGGGGGGGRGGGGGGSNGGGATTAATTTDGGDPTTGRSLSFDQFAAAMEVRPPPPPHTPTLLYVASIYS